MECAGSSDDDEEDAWYVVAEYATDQRSAMDTVEIVEDIWHKAEQFMHQAGLYMHSGHIGKADDLLSLRTDSDVQSFVHIHVSA